MVGDEGFEPPTFCSQSRRSSQAELISVSTSGAEGGNRTHDPFLTKEEHYHYATTAGASEETRTLGVCVLPYEGSVVAAEPRWLSIKSFSQ